MLYAISACLAGENCKYNGGNNYDEKIEQICENNDYVLICPELTGGLEAPRPPAEISGGSGEDVLAGSAKVFSKEGDDWTSCFIEGAYASLDTVIAYAKEGETITAILKARSPSCGSCRIYDGSFGGNLINGNGVTAALFKQKGIKVMSELDLK